MSAQRDEGSDEQGPVAGSFLSATFIAPLQSTADEAESTMRKRHDRNSI
jgi:hypothetical protein